MAYATVRDLLNTMLPPIAGSYAWIHSAYGKQRNEGTNPHRGFDAQYLNNWSLNRSLPSLY